MGHLKVQNDTFYKQLFIVQKIKYSKCTRNLLKEYSIPEDFLSDSKLFSFSVSFSFGVSAMKKMTSIEVYVDHYQTGRVK